MHHIPQHLLERGCVGWQQGQLAGPQVLVDCASWTTCCCLHLHGHDTLVIPYHAEAYISS